MREKKEINKKIGANIQNAREYAKYTQEELAEVIGITPNHLSAIERGASGASLETIEKLCNHLGISADYLFFGEDMRSSFFSQLVTQLNRVRPEYQPQIQKIISALLEVLTMQETQRDKET